MSSPNEGASGKEREITRARIRDLEYFLGEGWIDYGMIGVDMEIAKYRNYATSAYQPKKCLQCSQYWHYTLGGENKKTPIYLNQSVFANIPAEKETCWKCIKE